MSSGTPVVDLGSALREVWELRNAATTTLVLTELQLRTRLETADTPEVVALLESFSPARSPGPAWTRSFEPLVERLWAWCSPAVLAEVEAQFRGRGAPWLSVANSFQADHGSEVRGRLQRRSAQARLPNFTIE